MSLYPLTKRSSGILLHPTSLPSGKLDDDVYRWLDFLADSCQQVWQVLPLGIPAMGNSPYQCLSAFAANPDLLPDSENHEMQQDDPAFLLWQQEQAHWLDDFVLYTQIKRLQNGSSWYDWPEPFRHRHEDALKTFTRECHLRLQQQKWQQYQIHMTWQKVLQAAHERDIHLFGDMPIFVAHDSADVWAHQENFLLDETGHSRWVTGVPPDYFSETGQRWGNPHYNWGVMVERGFKWWLQRLQHHFQWFDLVRIDHFRGLEAVWMIDANCDTAIDGHWSRTPGDQLLARLQDQMGSIPLVAEDLGIITPEVTALREKFKLPGMSILQFAFDAFEDNPHKPANITPDRIVYTGTHDNNTTVGWFQSLLPHEQQHVLDVLGISQADDIVDTMVSTAMHSQAILSVFPLQDILKLGPEARMNIPGDVGDHWQWQFDWSQITPDIAQKLKQVTHDAERC
jgi:4-alpha-glucanotransferase